MRSALGTAAWLDRRGLWDFASIGAHFQADEPCSRLLRRSGTRSATSRTCSLHAAASSSSSPFRAACGRLEHHGRSRASLRACSADLTAAAAAQDAGYARALARDGFPVCRLVHGDETRRDACIRVWTTTALMCGMYDAAEGTHHCPGSYCERPAVLVCSLAAVCTVCRGSSWSRKVASGRSGLLPDGQPRGGRIA